MSDYNRKFAFGMNYCDGAACPAETAGFNSCGDVLPAAEWYDEIVKEEIGSGHGVVSEETAKTAWLTAVSILDDDRFEDMYWEPAYLEARKVAKELGWM